MKFRYTSQAKAALALNICPQEHTCVFCCKIAASDKDAVPTSAIFDCLPHLAGNSQHIHKYKLTSELATWVKRAMLRFRPEERTSDLVAPFSLSLHRSLEAERPSTLGSHNLDSIELTYQVTLWAAAAVLLAADRTVDPVNIQSELHASEAGGDDHFKSWGPILTGLDCQPPIIAMFPIYLMMCQAFTFEEVADPEDYVYAALTGVDWTKKQSAFGVMISEFERQAKLAVPGLDDYRSSKDRSFWRIAHAYLEAVNSCENSRTFRAPRSAAIAHGLDLDLIIAMRGIDTIGSAYMCTNGAAWLDDAGFGSLIGSALPNDVMDLHTDIKTGETRNLLRLLYPQGLTIERAMKIMSTVLSGLLAEVYRGHRRAHIDGREDGRIVSTSPPYSFFRARHRKIFETLETYMDQYPEFWTWTWTIFNMAKKQLTEAGLQEPLVCALKRADSEVHLPESPLTSFYNTSSSYYKLVESQVPLSGKHPLAVSENLADVIRSLHHIWHIDLTNPGKTAGWGRNFDIRSDKLFGDAGKILSESGSTDEMYKFAVAYGRLSMALPYIAYHTIAAIILACGTAN